MKHKRIIITGASSGLGRHLAIKLSRMENLLLLIARREEELLSLKNEINKVNPKTKVEILAQDVCLRATSQKALEICEERFGGLDVFIANAGKSMWSRFSDLENPEKIRDLMDINFNAVVLNLHAFMPSLKKSKGSFIVVSSIQGSIPVPYHSGYVASKFAVNGFIETVRLEEPDIHFLIAQPAWISGTELRSKALVSEDQSAIKVSTKHKSKAMPACEVADKIITAIIRKQNKLFIPSKFAFLPLLRLLFPKWLDQIIKLKVNKELK